MLCETERKKNMGFINTCNNPLNPKLHASYATCIGKPDKQNPLHPSPRGRDFLRQ